MAKRDKYVLERKEPFSFKIVTEGELFDLAFRLIDPSKITKTYPHDPPPYDHASAKVEDLYEALYDNGYTFRKKTW